MVKYLKSFLGDRFFVSYIFLVFIFVGYLFFRFRFDNSFLLLVDYLESASINKTGAFLSGQSLSFFPNSIGIIRLGLPNILLSFFSKLGTPADVLLFATNYLLVFSSIVIVLFSMRNEKHFKAYVYALFPLIFISPVILRTISFSLEFNLTCFFFILFSFTKNETVRTLCVVAALLSSVVAVPLFLVAILINFFIEKRRLHSVIQLIIVIVWSIFFVKSNGLGFVDTYFPILNPQTHGFYIQIHRQADVTLGVPFMGKIFYNKYIVIVRAIFEEMSRIADWDYWIFHNATGKYVSTVPTYAFVSLIELPFILFGIVDSVKKKIRFVFFAPAILFSMALYYDSQSISLLFYLLLSLFFVTGYLNTMKNRPKFIWVGVFLLILISRVILTCQSVYAVKEKDTTFRAYEELATYIKGHNVEKIVVTDRLSQPHIYLAYFELLDVEQLQSKLQSRTSRDSKGLYQPDSVEDFVFRSFNYSESKDILHISLEYYLVEYTESIPDSVKADSGVYEEFETKIPKEKSETNLVLIKR